MDNSALLERVRMIRPAQISSMPITDFLMEDDFSMDFTDTLFTTLNQQNFQFPNPKEMCKLFNSHNRFTNKVWAKEREGGGRMCYINSIRIYTALRFSFSSGLPQTSFNN